MANNNKMTIIEALVQLRDDLKKWVANNLRAVRTIDTDIVLAGDYETIGNKKVGDKFVQGTNIQDILKEILTKRILPTATLPSITLNSHNAKSYEVGETVTPTYKITFNPGEYSYNKDVPTGVVISELNVSFNGTNNKISNPALNTADNTYEGSLSSFTITEGMNEKVTIEASYSTPDDYQLTLRDNLETILTEEELNEIKIKDGTTDEVKTGSYIGYRKSFYGTLDEKIDITSNLLRNPIAADGQKITSTSSGLSNGSTFTINIPQGCKRVVIAYPSNLRDMTSVLDENDSNANIVSAFGSPQKIQIAGAASGYDKEYKVYTTDFANPYSTNNKYKVTI